MYQERSLTSITGKPLTVSAGFRITLPLYERVVSYAKEKGLTVSAATVQLWEKELSREGLKDVATSVS